MLCKYIYCTVNCEFFLVFDFLQCASLRRCFGLACTAVDFGFSYDNLFFKNQYHCGMAAGAIFNLAQLCCLFKCDGMALKFLIDYQQAEIMLSF